MIHPYDGYFFLAHGIRVSVMLSWVRNPFLAHRISEILPWDRKSYLTHDILPRLSHEGYIHYMYWKSCTLSSSDVIVMLK